MGGGASKGSKRAGTSRKGKGDAFLSASPAPPQVPFEGPLERLSVPELRTFIEESGASHGDIFERSDLVERARRIGPLERLKPNALRRLLDATGRGHADCLEKSELVDRLRAAIDAGGKMAMEQQQDDASSSTDAQSAGDFATAAVTPAAPPPRAGAPTAPVPSQIRPGVLAAALDPPEEFREFRSPAEMRRQQKQRQAAHTLGATPAHTTQPPQQTTSPPQPQPNQQQQAAALHMLEARLAVEKERREAALAEKALLEQELVAARAAAQDERARSGEAAVENEMALADAQQQIAELTAELHRARRAGGGGGGGGGGGDGAHGEERPLVLTAEEEALYAEVDQIDPENGGRPLPATTLPDAAHAPAAAGEADDRIPAQTRTTRAKTPPGLDAMLDKIKWDD